MSSPSSASASASASLARALTPASASREAHDYILKLVPALAEALTQVTLTRPAQPLIALAIHLLQQTAAAPAAEAGNQSNAPSPLTNAIQILQEIQNKNQPRIAAKTPSAAVAPLTQTQTQTQRQAAKPAAAEPATTQPTAEKQEPAAAAVPESVSAVGSVMERVPVPLRVIIAGAACSGKGSQCEFIRAEYGLVHISTGDLLRAAVEAGSELGMTAKGFMEAGQLIPDDLMIGLVRARLNEPDCLERGWLLDGFPRSPGQARALSEAGIEADVFFVLDVPDSVLIERVVGRRLDPETGRIYHLQFEPPSDETVASRLIQRSDDTEEKIQVRLASYHQNVASIEDQYSRIIQKLDGNRPKTAIFADIKAAINRIQTK